MKGVLEIRKLFWLINSVLLTILVYIVFNFIPDNNTGKSTITYPVPIKEKLEIIPCKNHLLSGNHRIIVKRNIFSSLGLNPSKENLQREQTEAPAGVIGAQLRLLATVAGDDHIACAVIENMKSKLQDVYKTGDIIEGAKIGRIGRNKIVLFYRERLEVLNLHIAREVLDPVEKHEEPVLAQKQNTTDSVNVVSPFEREINKRTFITQVPGIEVSLEKIEAVPYIINGQQEGLCITGLDDLNMAGYFGFENGDVIQAINGQMLTDKQKAFQALKKARSQSSLNFQLLRNEQKMHLFFGIK